MPGNLQIENYCFRPPYCSVSHYNSQLSLPLKKNRRLQLESGAHDIGTAAENPGRRRAGRDITVNPTPGLDWIWRFELNVCCTSLYVVCSMPTPSRRSWGRWSVTTVHVHAQCFMRHWTIAKLRIHQNTIADILRMLDTEAEMTEFWTSYD
jgi:hypothetical protein